MGDRCGFGILQQVFLKLIAQISQAAEQARFLKGLAHLLGYLNKASAIDNQFTRKIHQLIQSLYVDPDGFSHLAWTLGGVRWNVH